ncbi:hypothetical protein D9M71_399260 [compost metagenome]
MRVQRHQRTQADRGRAGRRPARGRHRQRSKNPVPGDHEPRNPHTAVRRVGDPGAAVAHRARRPATRLPAGNRRLLVNLAAVDLRRAGRVQDRGRSAGPRTQRVQCPGPSPRGGPGLQRGSQEQGAAALQLPGPTPAGTPDRRRQPDPPDPQQPAEQCGQVHRLRPRGAAGQAAQPRRRTLLPVVAGLGHGQGHRRTGPAVHLRAFLPDRRP